MADSHVINILWFFLAQCTGPKTGDLGYVAFYVVRNDGKFKDIFIKFKEKQDDFEFFTVINTCQ
jgi:hypothetical protein